MIYDYIYIKPGRIENDRIDNINAKNKYNIIKLIFLTYPNILI